MKNEELITALRYCAEHDGCDYYIAKDCPIGNTWVCGADCEQMLMLAVADALEATDRLLNQNTERCEELRKQLREAHESYEKHLNELEAQIPKEGEWIWEYYHWHCSVCGKNPTHGMGYVQGKNELFRVCPNCGARMDGKVKSNGN